MAVEYDDSDVQQLADELQHRDLLPSDVDRMFQKVLSEARVPAGDTSPEDRSAMLQRLGMNAYQLARVTGVPVQTVISFTEGRNPGPLLEGPLKKAAAIAKKAKAQREAYGD